MASVTLRKGLSNDCELGQGALLIVGKNRHLKKVDYSQLQGILNEFVDEKLWQTAIDRLPESGSMPLYLDQAQIISVPGNFSRHNAPSGAVNIFREIKDSAFAKKAKNGNVVLFVEYVDVVASVAAIARSFPLFSRKTPVAESQEVKIDIVLTDEGKELTDTDLAYLESLVKAIRTTGRLIDMPANELTTNALVKEAEMAAAELGVKCTVIRGEELLEQGFGGIYHVGKAGPTPPAFVVLSHLPSGAYETYALVGKGVVYDTGGMQIKGKTMMPNMKRDMGGAAGMLGAFSTLVKSGFKQNLHACLCIVENNISPAANKPDDIITMLSGKTVEINNTDAEGRLILADGVYYAKNTLKATTIIDMATLTGAMSYMTGRLHGAVLTNSELWEQQVCSAGRRSGDLIGSMVFCPELHFPDLKSTVADMKNSNLGRMEGPPSAVAGHFIGAHIQFGEGLNWIHLDIQAPAESGDRGTGFGPALLSTLLGNHTDVPLLHH